MATLGFMDSDGVDLGNKYVTKDYVMTWYPNLPSNMVAPQLLTWGYDNYGQLGDNTIIAKSSPIQTITGGTNWKSVACGYGYVAAIKTDGSLWGWGQNNMGSLGDNTTTNKSSPVQTVAGGSNWIIVAGGGYRIAAIKTDGTLWVWGRNYNGELGDNTTILKSSPVQTIAGGTNWKIVACGHYHTAAVKTDGTLWMWGYNSFGQLGDNSIVDKSSPVQTIAGGTNWKQVSAGAHHSGAVKTDGTLWLWGRDDYGQLGNNTTVHKSSPVQTAAGGTNWKSVSGGWYHTATIKTDGTLWMWGRDDYGQLGDNTTVHKSSPVQTAAGGTNWKLVSSGYQHTAAVKTDGTLWGWGRNIFGQLGDNTGTNRSSPVQTVAGGTNWKSVSGGGLQTAALSEASGW